MSTCVGTNEKETSEDASLRRTTIGVAADPAREARRAVAEATTMMIGVVGMATRAVTLRHHVAAGRNGGVRARIATTTGAGATAAERMMMTTGAAGMETHVVTPRHRVAAGRSVGVRAGMTRTTGAVAIAAGRTTTTIIGAATAVAIMAAGSATGKATRRLRVAVGIAPTMAAAVGTETEKGTARRRGAAGRVPITVAVAGTATQKGIPKLRDAAGTSGARHRAPTMTIMTEGEVRVAASI